LYNPRFGTTEVYANTRSGISYRYYANSWSGWINLGGTVSGNPAPLYNPRSGTTEVYANTGGDVSYRYYYTGWSGWIAPQPPPPPAVPAPAYPSYVAPRVGAPQKVSCSTSGGFTTAIYKIVLSGGRYSLYAGGMSRADIGWNGGPSTYTLQSETYYPAGGTASIVFFSLSLANPGSTDGQYQVIPFEQLPIDANCNRS
ncbi:hypothetical protein HC031_28530, partial [Planosporangium thailandense]|nr:hypothetical protein [Planosporangium thailandense]